MSDGNCSAPGPQRIYDLLVGYWKTGIVKAAIELDVFSSIADGENSIRKLASSRGVEERGLRVLLEQAPDIAVVGEAGDGEAALAQVEALRPRVAVLDCQLPGMAGAAVAAAIRWRGLPTRVLALSAYSDEQHVHIVNIDAYWID